MQRAFDAGTVVVAEFADAVDDHLQVFHGDLGVAQVHFAMGETRLGQASKIHDDFNQLIVAVDFVQRLVNACRQHRQHRFEIVSNLE